MIGVLISEARLPFRDMISETRTPLEINSLHPRYNIVSEASPSRYNIFDIKSRKKNPYEFEREESP